MSCFVLQEFRQQVVDSLEQQGIGAVLSPGLACPAVPVGLGGPLGRKLSYPSRSYCGKNPTQVLALYAPPTQGA